MWNCIVFTTIWIYIFSTKSLSNKVIRAKKSPCEGWLRFLVDQKQSSSRLVILNSRPLSSAYFAMSFMKMSIMVDFFFFYIFSSEFPSHLIYIPVHCVHVFFYSFTWIFNVDYHRFYHMCIHVELKTILNHHNQGFYVCTEDKNKSGHPSKNIGLLFYCGPKKSY